MDLQMILFIALIIIFFIIPLLTFIIKSAVKQGILEAYKIIKNDKDKFLNFREVLQRVDTECSIIPPIYAENGYALFSRLSEIAHGNSDEATALKEYDALKRLVFGIIENVKRKNKEIKNNAEIKKALIDAGFVSGGDKNE